jgi:hypothetical protein
MLWFIRYLTRGRLTTKPVSGGGTLDGLPRSAEDISAVKVERAFAVAELLDIVAAKRAQHAQHHVRERRAILRPQMDSTIERTTCATGDEERHALAIVTALCGRAGGGVERD